MAKPHPFFLLWCLAFFIGISANASSTFTSGISRSYAETIKLRLGNGRNLIRAELQRDPQNAVALLVANYQDFLTLCVQQNPKQFEQLVKAQENRLDRLTSLKERSAWVDYSIAEVRTHLAVSKLLLGNRLASAWEFRQAYLQYEANARRYPSFLPNKKTLGAMQVLIGSVPDTYRWFLNIIGMRGSVPAGMANLKAATSNSNPFQQEAQVMYVLLQQLLDQQHDLDAQQQVNKLVQESPDNLLYTFVAMYLHKKTKVSEQALQFYLKRPTGAQYLAFPYLHHMAADLYLYRGDYSRSIQENKLFLETHKGEHYLKAAHYKLYLANWFGNNKQQASWHYREINRVGSKVVEEDIYAARFVEQQTPLNNHLMLARLRSDGGYYKEALAGLNKMRITENTPLPEKAEYYYRKARIYHGLHQVAEAKQHYEYTIRVCGSSDLYFAPNAALQLGYLYQEEKNFTKAKVWYRKALNYKGHEYKNSIDHKAKLALSSLE
ncbi:tetratricopeptide repeat protein [Pontibacter ruber]|uniref:Tetratricopeptide repeat protein n=1 Tax=Pontibacter ruber TaxID=1343895 RepID=A0ABW5CS86_9BACT|nr:DUF3808 domain-containing protein [Pontibacter ruber]